MSRPWSLVSISESVIPLTATMDVEPSGPGLIRISNVSVDRTRRNSNPKRKKKNPIAANTRAQTGM
jgi:hypothetical protein